MTTFINPTANPARERLLWRAPGLSPVVGRTQCRTRPRRHRLYPRGWKVACFCCSCEPWQILMGLHVVQVRRISQTRLAPLIPVHPPNLRCALHLPAVRHMPLLRPTAEASSAGHWRWQTASTCYDECGRRSSQRPAQACSCARLTVSDRWQTQQEGEQQADRLHVGSPTCWLATGRAAAHARRHQTSSEAKA